MFSVTPDAPASVPFQSTPSRSARFDQPSGNDSFAALVDSNTATDNGNDRAPAPAQDQSATPRRSDDTPAATDNRGPQNPTATDQPAGNSSDSSNTGTGQPAKADGNTDAVQQPATKSGASKAAATKSTAKTSPGDNPAAKPSTDPAVPALPSGAAVTTPNAVAVAIPVAAALTDVPAVSPVSGNATAPLAIAAAAIAASTAAPLAAAASSAQTNTDTDAAATAAASAAPVAAASDAVASAKVEVQTAASKVTAAPVIQQTTPTAATPATATADVALVTAVAAKTPVAPKATLKASVAAPTGTAPSGGDPDATPGTSDPSATAASTGTADANLAQQPAAAGKQKTADGVADAVKTDDVAAPSPISATTVSTREHPALANAGNIPADPSDAGAQAAGAIQPQFQPVAATTAPAGALGVTAATTGAVPLSGLALEIAVSAQSGKSRFEIRLDPADLGRIDVRIEVDSNGQVTSHLTVEKPATLSMLQQDAPQLQRALNDAGLTTGNDGLQFSLRDQSSSGQNDGSGPGRNAQRLVISDENTIPAAIAGQTYGRTLGSSGGVDIRV